MVDNASESSGLIGQVVRDVMSKNYASQRSKVQVAQSLLKIAANFDDDADVRLQRQQEHMQLFERVVLRTQPAMMSDRDRDRLNAFGAERRDMQDTAGGAYPGSTTAFEVPVLFEAKVWEMMKAVDPLFDEDVVTFLRSDKGGPMSIPALDDTSSAATVIAQSESVVQAEPVTIGQLSFAVTSTWSSGLWKISRSLLADSGIPIPDLFAQTAATRFRRGIGASFVDTLLDAASLGWVAQGSSSTDGIGLENTIGVDDLHELLASVNTEYLSSPKCKWLMNFSTYQALLRVKDRQARPVLRENYNAAGEPILLGKPVAICPSMPSMSSTISSPAVSVAPVIVGDLSRLICRVAGPMRLVRIDERFAEYFQTAFESFVRADAGLMVTEGSDAPIKYLTTAA